MSEPTVSPWSGDQPPSESELESIFRNEGLSPRWWSNGPGDRYGAHSHGYHKVLYCSRGSIRFQLDGGRQIDLAPGDRLEIPPGVTHSAVVGPRGVACIEAPRP